MSMDYIRKTYGVPAKRGARVRFTDGNGVVWEGKITAAQNGRLRVRVEGRGTLSLHPTWNVEYV